MKTENDHRIRTTCPLMRLFAPLMRAVPVPPWEELELSTHETDGRLDLRLLHAGCEAGRLLAERSVDGGFRHKAPASGPRWCRELLQEAAAEWARQEAVHP